MLEIFLASVVTFFVVIDPPGCTPLFTSLTKDMPLALRHRMAWKSVVIATFILFGFAFAGEWVLDKLHVSLDAFRIAGGLLLFIIALIGNGLGPQIVGILSDTFMGMQIEAAGMGDQLTNAICRASAGN